jgi:hypothetical protein
MGVAVGRVQSKAGLRVKNFNKGAATLKHPSCVYDFYNNMNVFKEPLDDLSCCKTNTTTTESYVPLPSASDLVDDIPEENENDVDIEIDLPQLQNPYEMQVFLLANEKFFLVLCSC